MYFQRDVFFLQNKKYIYMFFFVMSSSIFFQLSVGSGINSQWHLKIKKCSKTSHFLWFPCSSTLFQPYVGYVQELGFLFFFNFFVN